MSEPEDPKPTEASPDAPAWSRLHVWQIQWVRDLLMIAGVIGLFWLGQKISIVTVPLLLALLLAYLFEPLIRWLEARRLSRSGAVVSVLVVTVLFVGVPTVLGLSYGVVQGIGFVSTGSARTASLVDSVTTEFAARGTEATLADLRERVASPPDGEEAPSARDVADAEAGAESARVAADEALGVLSVRANDNWVKIRDRIVGAENRSGLEGFFAWVKANADSLAGRAASAGASAGKGALRALTATLGGVFSVGFMAFLTAFFFFFVSTGWGSVKDFAAGLLPTKNRERVLELAVKFDRVISAFIRGRLTIAFIQSIVFTVGYWIIGVPAPLILGPAVALLSIVPYLALIGIPISVTLLWLENHSGVRGELWWVLGAPTIFYFIGQALDDYVLTPMIQGKGTDMSTPAILFASLAGGVLFGVFGLLIAIPIAACLKIVLQEIFWPKFKDWAEGREKDFLPIDRG